MSEDLRFFLRPGEEHDGAFDLPEDESGQRRMILYGQTDFVIMPHPGTPEIPAGTKLYVKARDRIIAKCPHCGQSSAMLRTLLQGTNVFVLSCTDCDQFLWCEPRITTAGGSGETTS